MFSTAKERFARLKQILVFCFFWFVWGFLGGCFFGYLWGFFCFFVLFVWLGFFNTRRYSCNAKFLSLSQTELKYSVAFQK